MIVRLRTSQQPSRITHVTSRATRTRVGIYVAFFKWLQKGMIDCCFIYIYLRIQLFENFLKSKMPSKFGRQILKLIERTRSSKLERNQVCTGPLKIKEASTSNTLTRRQFTFHTKKYSVKWSSGHPGAKLKLKGSYRAIHFLQKKN